MSGPIPTPSVIVDLKNDPSNRRKNTVEPKPSDNAPKVPKHLDAEEKKVWKETARLLSMMGLLTETDANSLEIYSTNLVRWRTQIEMLKQEGEILFGVAGGAYINPRANLVASLAKMIDRFHVENGMTPAARARLRMPNEKPKENKREEMKIVKMSC